MGTERGQGVRGKRGDKQGTKGGGKEKGQREIEREERKWRVSEGGRERR